MAPAATAVMFFLFLPAIAASAEKKATPEDLTVSCSIDAASRTVTVSLFNKGPDRLYLQRRSTLVDYQGTLLSSKTLVPVPDPNETRIEEKPANPWAAKLRPTGGSVRIEYIEPHGSVKDSFPLNEHFAIPKEGGNFILRIGRVLYDDVMKDQIVLCPQRRLYLPPIN